MSDLVAICQVSAGTARHLRTAACAAQSGGTSAKTAGWLLAEPAAMPTDISEPEGTCMAPDQHQACQKWLVTPI